MVSIKWSYTDVSHTVREGLAHSFEHMGDSAIKVSIIRLPLHTCAMGVPVVPCADSHRAATQAGNSFNFATVGVVQLVALVCLKLLPVSSDTKSDMDSSSSSS